MSASTLSKYFCRGTLQRGSTASFCNAAPFSFAGRTAIKATPGSSTRLLSLKASFPWLSARPSAQLLNHPSPRRSILHFTQNAIWKATHRNLPPSYSPAGRSRQERKLPWLDKQPQEFIFWGILAVNGVVFIMWYYAENTYKQLRDATSYLWMRENFTVSMENVKSGRLWTILTACFSQSGTTHLLFNGLTYFFMARPVLMMLGNTQFLVLYLGGGIISSLTSLFWNSSVKNSPNYASHGASGAIYSIISYFACRQPFTKFLIFGIIPIPAWVFVPGVLLYDGYEMVSSKYHGNTDVAGHVGGIFGGIAYFLFRRFGVRV